MSLSYECTKIVHILVVFLLIFYYNRVNSMRWSMFWGVRMIKRRNLYGTFEVNWCSVCSCRIYPQMGHDRNGCCSRYHHRSGSRNERTDGIHGNL